MAERTPRLRIYELMAPMPTRTVDDYMARVRRRWSEAMETRRPALIAEALARLEDLARKKVKAPRDLLRLERTRAELLGLVGGSATTQVNVGVQTTQSTPAIDQWPEHLVERARPHLEALRALREEAAAWAAGQQRQLPAPPAAGVAGPDPAPLPPFRLLPGDDNEA